MTTPTTTTADDPVVVMLVEALDRLEAAFDRLGGDDTPTGCPLCGRPDVAHTAGEADRCSETLAWLEDTP